MKTFTSSCLFFLLLVLMPFSGAYASHVSGAEITYTCTSTPGIYEITLVIYRNCDGVAICAGGCGTACTQSISVLGADPSCATSTFGSASLSLRNVRDVNSNPQCPNAKNTCNNMGCITPGTYTPGVERYEFKGLVNIGPTSGIPASCCNVRFSWELCCRTSQISTGSASQNFYIDATVNRCSGIPCNSSPVFKSEPLIVACGGETVTFNNGAFDPDHDSLSFAFAPALQGFNTPVTYTPPFAADKPMPWTGAWNDPAPAGIHCNAQTGEITFTPSNTSGSDIYGVVAIEVKQWKQINGVLTVIGTTRRDVNMIILANCSPNNTPWLITQPSAPNGGLKTTWEVCAGEQLCFNVLAKDSDFTPPATSDTTYLSWNKELDSLGATFLPTYNPADRHKPAPLGGPREDKYQFCWTPAENMVSDRPYYFTLSAKDSRCPNPGRLSQALSIRVFAKPDVSISNNPAGCGTFILSYTKNNPGQNITGSWIIANDTGDYTFAGGYRVVPATSANITVHFNQRGNHFIQFQAQAPGPLNAPPCIKVYSDTLRVLTTSIADSVIKTNITCFGAHNGSITVIGRKGMAPYKYRLNQQPYVTTNTFNGLDTGKYIIWVKDSLGCEISDTVTLTQPEKLIISGVTGSQIAFVNTSSTYSAIARPGATLAWDVTNGTILSGQGIQSVTVRWDTIGIGSVRLIAGSATCSFVSFQNVSVVLQSGLNELAKQLGLKVFPNPVKNLLNITLKALPEDKTITIYDLQGRMVLQQTLTESQQLNIEALTQGIYILKIGDWRGQIIKQ